jgi:proteasome accessory factor C
LTESAQSRLGRRLRRILLLLPYAIRHPGVSVDELARRFGASKQDLIDDLNLVFVCGLPGYGPGDLIDASLEDDRVYVTMADYFGSPLRLTPAEALALYAGAGALATLPELENAASLKSAIKKLGRAIGRDGGSMGESEITVELHSGTPEHLQLLQNALSEARQVRIDYYSANRGELTERTVDPWGLVAAVGRWYLVAWDHRREDERMFRVDRIKRVETTDAAASTPEDFDPERYRRAFVERGQEPVMTLEISPAAGRWFTDYYPVRRAETLSNGWTEVELAMSSERWAALLLLRLGADARKVKPASVAVRAREIALAIAARHGCAS